MSLLKNSYTRCFYIWYFCLKNKKYHKFGSFDYPPYLSCMIQANILQTYRLNNGTLVLGKLVKGKVQPLTFSNNLQVLTAATGVACSVYVPAGSRVRYIRIN